MLSGYASITLMVIVLDLFINLCGQEIHDYIKARLNVDAGWNEIHDVNRSALADISSYEYYRRNILDFAIDSGDVDAVSQVINSKHFSKFLEQADSSRHVELLAFAINKRNIDIIKKVKSFIIYSDEYYESLVTAMKDSIKLNKTIIFEFIRDLESQRYQELLDALLKDSCMYGHVSDVKLLLDVGANAGALAENGISHHNNLTPLMCVCKYNGDTEVVKLLLSKGVNLDEVDAMDGMTALMWACKSCNVNAVKLLLGQGANVNISDRMYGMTALMWACKMGDKESVKLILKHHVNIDAKDNDDKTALRYATISENLEINKLLIDYIENENLNQVKSKYAKQHNESDVALLPASPLRKLSLLGNHCESTAKSIYHNEVNTPTH